MKAVKDKAAKWISSRDTPGEAAKKNKATRKKNIDKDRTVFFCIGYSKLWKKTTQENQHHLHFNSMKQFLFLQLSTFRYHKPYMKAVRC